MKFRFEWPASRQIAKLPEGITAEQAIALDVNSGVFGPHNQLPEGHDAVAFYWHFTRPVMRNLCSNYICLLDGVELHYGESQPLRVGSYLQVGHFKLEITPGDACAKNDQDFFPLIYPDNSLQTWNKLPEVEAILSGGGSNTHDLHYFNDVIAQGNSEDALKMLEIEYKRYLIWQEQSGQYHDNVDNQGDYIIKTDNHFDSEKECLKEKTLTECIVDSTFLMEKVWPDFENSDDLNDIFAEAEKKDLLKILSPESVFVKEKYQIPELVFRDFHKTGLNSYY